MKKLFVSIMFVAIATVTFGQITNLYLAKKDQVVKTKDGMDSVVTIQKGNTLVKTVVTEKVIDSSIVINKIQASELIGSKYSTDKLDQTGFTSFRIGIMGTYQPTKWFAFKTWGMIQADNAVNPFSAQQSWIKLTPVKKLSIEMGYVSTIPSEQRPHPLDEGHFETQCSATIVGAAVNAKVKYQITNDFELAGGIAVRNKLPEYSGRVTYKKIQLSAWYAQWNKKVGSALTLDFTQVNSTLVWKQDQTLADILVIKLGKTKNTLLYYDIIYDFQKKDLTRNEFGVLRCFDLVVTEKVHLKGLFGLGYEHDTLHFENNRGTINVYGYFHL